MMTQQALSPIDISLLSLDQGEAWLDANILSRGNEHLTRLIGFLQDMQDQKRQIWVARREGKFMGHVTMQGMSLYPPFRQRKIPEIVDLWVEPEARRQSIGKDLLSQVIHDARIGTAIGIGLGVGITHDFGAAHRLYARMGFMPDGSGVWAQGRQVKDGDDITVAHDVIMMWVKPL